MHLALKRREAGADDFLIEYNGVEAPPPCPYTLSSLCSLLSALALAPPLLLIPAPPTLTPSPRLLLLPAFPPQLPACAYDPVLYFSPAL